MINANTCSDLNLDTIVHVLLKRAIVVFIETYSTSLEYGIHTKVIFAKCYLHESFCNVLNESNNFGNGRVDYASLIEFELMRVANTFANNNCMKDGDKNNLVTDEHDTGGCITFIHSTLLVYDDSVFQKNNGSYIIDASPRKETFENENITQIPDHELKNS